jgi:YgiT-type zinc finger domain-containing protein
MENNMVCLSCKTGEMQESTNAYFIQSNHCYVIIENVPCYKCSQCGEIFYKASVLEKIDGIMERLENVASKIFILDYANVA